MGIEKKNPANFSPSVEIPAKVDSFRFWCQKVLPLVYDDSLSYYELLCKVVDYLNNTIADVNTLGTDVDNLNKAYNELQSYVNDYFSTLDVQDEINNKLDEMASNGTLTNLITPLLPNLISEWLSKNITTTSPVIDKTLTISNAGADSKVVGDKFDLSVIYGNTATSVNELLKNGIYYINANTVNIPFTSAGIIVVMGNSSSFGCQLCVSFADAKTYIRSKTGGVIWSNWVELDSLDYPHPVAYQNTATNVDTLLQNGIYYVGTSTENMPFTGAGIIVVMGNSSSFGIQMAVEFSSSKTYTRAKTGGVVWTKWTELDSLDYPFPVAYQNTATNVDALLQNGIYYVGTSTENIPFTGAGIIVVMGNSSSFGIQIAVEFSSSKTYTRAKTGGVVWTKWVKLDNGIIRWENKKANFLGDSIVEGKKGNFVNVVSDYLSLSKANNYGIGGSRMASSDIDATLTPVCKIYDTIDEDADIIYVAAGTNDYSGQIPLGEENSNDITTFNGALNVTMQGLRNKFPTKLIIFANILSRYTDKNDTLPIKCDEYRTAIKNRCYANHIIFYDSYKYSGFDFSNGANELTADGLHPNQVGADILGRKISGFINWQ